MLTSQHPKEKVQNSRLKRWVIKFLCGSSPAGAVESWMETGATKGAITGAVAGFGTVGVATFGIGGIPGGVLGGFIGGVVGGSAGTIWGGGAAAVCSYVGVYE